MAECDICGKEENMPYHCRHCGGTHCGDHRLPESHDCPGLDDWGQRGPVFDSGFEETIGQTNGTRSTDGLASRLGIDIGPGGTYAYFRNNMTYVFLGIMWLTLFAQWFVLLIGGQSLHNVIFTASTEHPLYVWTWFTSIFAHDPGGIIHILFNSIVIFFFGRLVEQYVGSRDFALLFIGSGVLAGLGQIAFTAAQGGTAFVLGASGAALAIMGVLTILNPKLTVYLYFILPIPIWLLTAGIAAISVLFMGTGGGGNIAHAAHLFGLLLGIAYGYHVRDRVRTPSQLQLGGGGPGGGMGGPGGPGGPGGRGPF